MAAWKKYSDTISGGVLLLFSIFYLYQAYTIKVLSRDFFNSSLFPKILGVGLAVLSVIQILDSLKKIKLSASEHEPETGVGKAGVLRIVSTLIALAIYIFFLKSAGFLIMTILYVFAQILILTPRHKQKIWLIALLSVVFSAIVYGVFLYGFQLMLPRGILNF